jgi:hypothetical protein
VRSLLVGLTMSLAATSLTACGSTNMATRSGRFFTSANAVCTIYYNAAYALPPPVGVAQLEAFPRKQQVIRERERVALGALSAPESQKRAYARYLADMTTLNRLYASAIAQIAAAIRNPSSPRERTAAEAAQTAPRLEAQLPAEARALGLTQCAKNPYSATHYANSAG